MVRVGCHNDSIVKRACFSREWVVLWVYLVWSLEKTRMVIVIHELGKRLWEQASHEPLLVLYSIFVVGGRFNTLRIVSLCGEVNRQNDSYQ